MLEKYPIKTPDKDFAFSDFTYNTKGTRAKRVVTDINGEKAFFKYKHPEYITSELCSEKMSYEIAKVLDYNCAKIEFAQDEDGQFGILNYWFTDEVDNHTDAVSYFNTSENKRNEFYTISNIKRVLDEIDYNLFHSFIKIMVFDALVGEQDRHEENWGVLKQNNKYEISPLYDNGDNLLNKFENQDYAQQYYDNANKFDAYIRKSRTLIYKEDKKSKYKHFELIEYLNNSYYNAVQQEINNLKKLTDEKIKEIVDKVPDDLLTTMHKQYIIYYLKKRRDILLGIK